MPTFGRSLTVTISIALAASGAGATPGAAHTAGQCAVDVAVDRCETWAHTYDDAEIRPPNRSDQFVAGVAATGSTVFLAVKDVALNPDDPYAATGTWAVVAYDAVTGDQRWESKRASRVYDFPSDVAVAPDGRHIYVTGAAYDAFSVSATDSRMVTVAYDAATGAEVWSSTWDNRADGTDNGKVVTVSPDGREVYVGGITTTAQGDLDYLTVAYDSRRGRQLWEATYAGTPEGSDALFAVGVAPEGSRVYVTGWSDSGVPYDSDYATVAYRTGRHRPGSVAWVARYDGVAANRSDRANALAVAADGSVLVTGDSYAPGTGGGTRYDVATVRYAGASGALLWDARYAGPRNGLDSGDAVAATGGRVAVTAQAVGTDQDSGHDTVTLGYDLRSGEEVWAHREDAPRSSEHPAALALSSDGTTAYVLTSAAPVVPYTALDEMVLHAYRMSDGTARWTSRLDAGAGNAVSAGAMAVLPDGQVAAAGQVTRSQSPLGPPSQNRYDSLTAVYQPVP